MALPLPLVLLFTNWSVQCQEAYETEKRSEILKFPCVGVTSFVN